MRKVFLIAAFAVFAMGVSHAQEVKYGVKAGLNLATVIGDETDGLEGRTGFHFGGVAEIVLSDKFSFQPELIYSTQGAKEKFSETFEGVTFNEETEVKFAYLNVPLLAKYYVAEGLSIEAGPQIGFLLAADIESTETATSGGITVTESVEADAKDLFKSIDFGVGVGLGYKLDNGFNFAARYNLGLSDINDFESDGSNTPKNQNSVIQFSVGYTFN